MKNRSLGLTLACLAAMLAGSAKAHAQGSPTALQKRQLSVFGAASGDFTGLAGGKNVSFTGGVDLGLLNYRFLRPTLEVRGRYPIAKGTIDDQKNIMGGLRVDVLLSRRIHPYADFLAGRGSTDYPNGYIYNNFDYDLTTTFVYAGGVGLDYDLNEHFAIKLDGQVEHWGAAPVGSGSIASKVATAGLVYHFDFNHHHRR